MFAIEKRRAVSADIDIPVIADGYEVIHFDEFPILFTGFNAAGSRLLCSFVEESRRSRIARHFYTIVPPDEYASFIRGSVTYRDILLRAKYLFIVDEGFDGVRAAVYLLDIAKVPADLLPSHDSFFPRPRIAAQLGFGARLRGQMADAQRADPGDLRVIENCLPGLVTDGLDSLNVKDMVPRVAIAPYDGGSFQLGFTVTTQWEKTLPLFGTEQYSQFAIQYTDYCVNHFQHEGSNMTIDNWKETAPMFADLVRAYEGSACGIEKGGHAAELLRCIRKSVDRLQDLTAIIGQNFTTVELRSVTDAGDVVLGLLDKNAAERVSTSIEKYDARSGDATEDAEDTEYRMVVYNLNVETRRGQAYVESNDKRSLYRVRFRVSGTEPLEESEFTASLDKGMKIRVLGRGKYVAGKIRMLMVVRAVAD